MSLLERSHILIIWILLSLCVAEFNMQMCPPSTRNGLCQLQSEIPNFNLSQAKIRVRRSTFKSSEPFSEKNKKQSKWMRNHNPPLTPLAAVIPFLSIKLDIHNGQISGLISDRGTINSPRSGSQPDNPLTDANSFGRVRFCDRCVFHYSGNIFTDCVNGHCPTRVIGTNQMYNYVACPANFLRAADCPASKPYFLRDPDKRKYVGAVGYSIRMECNIGGEVTRVQFYRDDLHQDKMDNLKDPTIESPDRVKFEYYSNTFVMIINNITISDEGSYTCWASNWHGVVSKSVTLTVTNGYKNACETCKFPFKYGSRVVKKCLRVSAKYYWCAPDVKPNFAYIGSLQCPPGFINVDTSCPEKWSRQPWCDICHLPFTVYGRVRNDCTTAGYRDKVTNRWCYKDDRNDDWDWCPVHFNGTKCHGPKPVKPKFTAVPNDIAVFKGSNATLRCPYHPGVPAATETWYMYRFNHKTNMTDKIISRGTLQIPNAELDDSGIYVCRIENLLGVESWSVKLIVSGVEPTFNDDTGTDVIVRATEGESVTFDCTGTSMLKGYLDLEFARIPDLNSNKLPEMPDRVEFGNGTDLDAAKFIRVITNLSVSDTGGYRCILRNAVAHATKDFWLQVIDKGRPYIVNPGYQVIREYKGLNIEFICAGAGSPSPTFKFRKKGDESSEFVPRFSWTKTGSYGIQVNYTVNISEAQIGDSGEYECVFSNKHGFATKVISIHVANDPFEGPGSGIGPDPFEDTPLKNPTGPPGNPPEYKVGQMTLTHLYWMLKHMSQEQWQTVLDFWNSNQQCTQEVLDYFQRIPNNHLDFAYMIKEDPGMTQEEFSYQFERNWLTHPECAHVFTRFLPQILPTPDDEPTPSPLNFAKHRMVSLYNRISDQDWITLTSFFDRVPSCKSNIQVWAGSGAFPKSGKEMASKISALNEYQYWYFDQLYSDHPQCKSFMSEMFKTYNI